VAFFIIFGFGWMGAICGMIRCCTVMYDQLISCWYSSWRSVVRGRRGCPSFLHSFNHLRNKYPIAAQVRMYPVLIEFKTPGHSMSMLSIALVEVSNRHFCVGKLFKRLSRILTRVSNMLKQCYVPFQHDIADQLGGRNDSE
jgi:hypothetical protein